MKYKVGDKVRVRCDLERKIYGSVSVVEDMIKYRGKVVTIAYVDKDDNTYKIAEEAPSWYWWSEEMLEPVDSKTLRMADGTIIGEFSTGGVLSTDELIKKEFNVAWIDKIALPTATETKEMVERVRREILNFTNAFPKEEKKLKFTFYFNVNEGTRIDKSCNGTIPTITTSVVLDKFGDPDRRKCYSLGGEATCDKADYDMRQGVLEALANAVFDGNFEKAYDKAVKTNAFCERQDRTCTYCGQLFDTIAEKKAHEAWHVERRKARHERYLLRKRAKEIAFEEAAQKLAKEMVEK